MEPHLNPTLSAETNHVFLDGEWTNLLKQRSETIERAVVDVQAIRKANLLDLTQPSRNPLEEHAD